MYARVCPKRVRYVLGYFAGTKGACVCYVCVSALRLCACRACVIM